MDFLVQAHDILESLSNQLDYYEMNPYAPGIGNEVSAMYEVSHNEICELIDAFKFSRRGTSGTSRLRSIQSKLTMLNRRMERFMDYGGGGGGTRFGFGPPPAPPQPSGPSGPVPHQIAAKENYPPVDDRTLTPDVVTALIVASQLVGDMTNSNSEGVFADGTEMSVETTKLGSGKKPRRSYGRMAFNAGTSLGAIALLVAVSDVISHMNGDYYKCRGMMPTDANDRETTDISRYYPPTDRPLKYDWGYRPSTTDTIGSGGPTSRELSSRVQGKRGWYTTDARDREWTGVSRYYPATDRPLKYDWGYRPSTTETIGGGPQGPDRLVGPMPNQSSAYGPDRLVGPMPYTPEAFAAMQGRQYEQFGVPQGPNRLMGPQFREVGLSTIPAPPTKAVDFQLDVDSNGRHFVISHQVDGGMLLTSSTGTAFVDTKRLPTGEIQATPFKLTVNSREISVVNGRVAAPHAVPVTSLDVVKSLKQVIDAAKPATVEGAANLADRGNSVTKGLTNFVSNLFTPSAPTIQPAPTVPHGEIGNVFSGGDTTFALGEAGTPISSPPDAVYSFPTPPNLAPMWHSLKVSAYQLGYETVQLLETVGTSDTEARVLAERQEEVRQFKAFAKPLLDSATNAAYKIGSTVAKGFDSIDSIDSSAPQQGYVIPRNRQKTSVVKTLTEPLLDGWYKVGSTVAKGFDSIDSSAPQQGYVIPRNRQKTSVVQTLTEPLLDAAANAAYQVEYRALMASAVQKTGNVIGLLDQAAVAAIDSAILSIPSSGPLAGFIEPTKAFLDLAGRLASKANVPVTAISIRAPDAPNGPTSFMTPISQAPFVAPPAAASQQMFVCKAADTPSIGGFYQDWYTAYDTELAGNIGAVNDYYNVVPGATYVEPVDPNKLLGEHHSKALLDEMKSVLKQKNVGQRVVVTSNTGQTIGGVNFDGQPPVIDALGGVTGAGGPASLAGLGPSVTIGGSPAMGTIGGK